MFSLGQYSPLLVKACNMFFPLEQLQKESSTRITVSDSWGTFGVFLHIMCCFQSLTNPPGISCVTSSFIFLNIELGNFLPQTMLWCLGRDCIYLPSEHFSFSMSVIFRRADLIITQKEARSVFIPGALSLSQEDHQCSSFRR